MAQGKETTVLVLTLLVTAGLAGGGFWYFQRNAGNKLNLNQVLQSPSNSSTPPIANTATNNTPATSFNIDTSQPNPTQLVMDGSTTMVVLIKNLQNAYSQVNPNIPTTFVANGTSKGIQNLISNSVQIAASSRPLQPSEAQANIQLVPIAKDAIAIIVSANNPFKGGLSLDQVSKIYQGKITNWAEVGGANVPIKVINRAAVSGTRDLFQNVVLLGQTFAPDSANFITWKQDETTAIMQQLGSNGISYATVSQVENQSTIRVVPVDGVSPTDKATIKSGKYPISRNIFLAINKQTSPAVKQFIDLALSPQGQQIAERSGFISLN